MKALFPLLLFLYLPSCSNEGGNVISHASKLTSTQLTLSAVAPCNSTSCTPTNLSGRIFAAGAMLGNDEDGSKNYHMTFIADRKSVINDPSDPSHPPGTKFFDLKQASILSGLISIPSKENMPSDPIVERVEMYFDYLDATVTLTNEIEGSTSYVIRTVMRKTALSDDVTGEMKIGDLLLRKGTEASFRWCDETSCDHSSRPASPLQDPVIKQIDEENDTQEGNPNYALYSVKLKEALRVTYKEIADTTRLWLLDFELEGAVKFSSEPRTFQTEVELMRNFSLVFACHVDLCREEEDAIQASLRIQESGSVPSS